MRLRPQRAEALVFTVTLGRPLYSAAARVPHYTATLSRIVLLMRVTEATTPMVVSPVAEPLGLMEAPATPAVAAKHVFTTFD